MKSDINNLVTQKSNEDIQEKKRAGMVFSEKQRNQFMRLRYKSDKNQYPFISINEMADAKNKDKYIQLSKSIISKLESEDIDPKNPPCRASTLRLYKEYFGCSYEYLMGDSELKKPEYYNIGKDSILNLFDDTYYDNLKELMRNEEYQHFNSYMLQAFMSNPQQLQYFLHTLFMHMYTIHNIKQDSSLTKAEKNVQTAYYWFSLNTCLKNYFENSLMPELEYGFKLHEQAFPHAKSDPHRNKAEERKAFEESLVALDLDTPSATTGEYEASLPPQAVIVSNVTATPINTKDSQ